MEINNHYRNIKLTFHQGSYVNELQQETAHKQLCKSTVLLASNISI